MFLVVAALSRMDITVVRAVARAACLAILSRAAYARTRLRVNISKKIDEPRRCSCVRRVAHVYVYVNTHMHVQMQTAAHGGRLHRYRLKRYRNVIATSS